MLNFKNVEDLVAYMFDQIDGEEPVSVVANKNLAVSTMQELLDYNDVVLKYANVDDWEYDKEYIVTLNYNIDTYPWDVSIEPIYNYEKGMYFGTDGFVLFHEDVNSKALIDMQKNENVELSGHDWFTIGEDELEDTDETEGTDEDGPKDKEDEIDLHDKKPVATSSSTATYKVNGKEVDKKTFDSAIAKIEDKYLNNIRDMLLGYCEIMEEMDEWRKVFHW